MSKQLDYNNLSEDDKAWLRARGWGNRIPGEVQTTKDTGVVLDPSASSEEALAQVPNTGTATVARPSESEPRYTEDDYNSWTVNDLKEEIRERNESRDESDHIALSGTKSDLVAALVEDDEAHPAESPTA